MVQQDQQGLALLGFGGHGGELRVGYRTAARLAGWSLDINGLSWRLAADLEPDTVDEFLLHHGQRFLLRLRIGTKGRVWQWRDVAIRVDGGTLTAQGEGRPGDG